MSKKDDITNAALELLVQKGIHNTPMSEIAKAANTGMGTIYNHFANKEILINEIYLSIKQKEEALFLEVDIDQPYKTQFENYLVVIIEFFEKSPSYFRFLQQLEASPIISEENRKKGNRSVEIVAELLRTAQENRVVKNHKMDEILVFIGGAISSYLTSNLHLPKNKRSSLTNHTGMVWDGIKG